MFGTIKEEFNSTGIRDVGEIAIFFNVEDGNPNANVFEKWDNTKVGVMFDLNLGDVLSTIDFSADYFSYLAFFIEKNI